MTLSSKQIDDIGNLYENIICETDYEKLGKEVRSNVRKGLEYARDWSNKNIEPAISATADFARGLGMKGSFVMGPGSSIPIDKPSQPKPSQPKPSQPAITKTAPIKDSGKEAGEWLAPSRGSSKAADPVVRAGGSYGFFGPIKPDAAKTSPSKPSTPPKKDNKVKTDPKGIQLEDATTIVAPRGGRAGTQEPGKPKTWKPITRSNDPRIAQYKKARGAEQLKTDKQLNKDVAAMNRQIAATPKGKDPETYRPPTPTQRPPAPRPPSSGAGASRPPAAKPPVAPKPAPVPFGKTMPAPASAAAAAAQTGNRTKDLSTWAKSNEKMISKVGTPQQRAILSAAKSGSAMPAPKPISTDIGDIKGAIKRSQERQAAQSGPTYSSSDVKSKMSSRTKTMLGLKDSYDIVLDYLVSQGHVDTLEEALYVMIEMDAENIRSIVEGVMPEPIDPAAHKAAQKTQKIYNLGKGTNNPNEAQSALKRTGPQLPGV